MSTNADGPVLKTEIEHIKIITTLLLLEEHDVIFLPNNSKEQRNFPSYTLVKQKMIVSQPQLQFSETVCAPYEWQGNSIDWC